MRLINPLGFPRVWQAALLAATLLLSACGLNPAVGNAQPTMTMPMATSVPATQPPTASIPVTGPHVTISNFTFTPATLTVPVGSTVTWVNQDDMPHTVTSVDKLFGSPALDTQNVFSFTFKTPGTYTYFCSIHPVMVGKIIVK